MNAENIWFCVLCWIVLTGLIAGAMLFAERRQNIRRQRKQHEDSMGEQPEPSGPSLTESQFRAAERGNIWPPPPQRMAHQLIPSRENVPYNLVWIIEDTFCFVIAVLGSVFSWGLLAFPILLLAVLAAILTKPRRAKSAAKSARGGQASLLFLTLLCLS